MRHWHTFLLLLLGLPSYSQVIRSGSANVPVSWRPAALEDSLLVDVDGDKMPDVVFKTTTISSNGPSQPSSFRFTAGAARGSNAEVAIDAAEYDSAHRFIVGDSIGPGLLWQRGGGYLAYTITGNGGTGGRGFFRSQEGFLAIRKRVGDQMRYWWFYLGTRSGNSDWVSYFAGTTVVLGRPITAALPPISAFPNPAATIVNLSQPAHYELFDTRGQLVSTSRDKPVNSISLDALPSGLYLLRMLTFDGRYQHQKLRKQ